MHAPSFQLFGLSHWAALGATVAAAAVMVRLHRSAGASVPFRNQVNAVLAGMLLLSVAVDPLLTWLRHRSEPEIALRLIRETALPLYLCDAAAVILAVALLTRRRCWVEVGYLWGLAGAVQGLLTPTLQYDWPSAEYFTFFIEHGGAPVAAIGLVFGMGLRPQPGAFRRGVLWGWVYMGVVGLLNFPLGTNYGFLRHKPEVTSILDYMGPEPWYLIPLQGVGILFFALLLLPFRREWRIRRSHPSADPAAMTGV
ncbi:MAG: family rane protein [Verrucomicrobiales bacterium]|nr:family rane protein [Verrucomicrobiales bacterium]